MKLKQIKIAIKKKKKKKILMILDKKWTFIIITNAIIN